MKTTNQTMLHAYTKAIDWLQYGKEFDEDCAEATLAVIRFLKEQAHWRPQDKSNVGIEPTEKE